ESRVWRLLWGIRAQAASSFLASQDEYGCDGRGRVRVFDAFLEESKVRWSDLGLVEGAEVEQLLTAVTEVTVAPASFYEPIPPLAHREVRNVSAVGGMDVQVRAGEDRRNRDDQLSSVRQKSAGLQQ